jgi:hypothetical protein
MRCHAASGDLQRHSVTLQAVTYSHSVTLQAVTYSHSVTLQAVTYSVTGGKEGGDGGDGEAA